MTDRFWSDRELDELRRRPKRVCNPQAQWSKKRGQYRQRNFDLCSEGGKEEKFLLYLRESLNDEKDFSCGLSLIQSGVRNLSLIRYNGSNHPHQEIHYQCHIHLATEEAQKLGRKVDSFAKQTDRYSDLMQAINCLIKDCNVIGFPSQYSLKGI